jgi:hypothetical protein
MPPAEVSGRLLVDGTTSRLAVTVPAAVAREDKLEPCDEFASQNTLQAP